MVILVAEDDASSRHLVARALEILGHTVETVVDGVELFRVAVRIRPDLILSDINMPRCDGITACRGLRQMLPGTRFMLMTGNSDAVDVAARAGFRFVLHKPFELARLKQGIDEIKPQERSPGERGSA